MNISLDFLREKSRLINEYVLQRYSPIELMTITVITTALGCNFYQYLFNHDEGE